MKTGSLFLECALLHQSQYAPFLTVAFHPGVCYILHKCVQQETNKNYHNPESKVSDPKRWHLGFTDCQQQMMLSLERQVPELANFKALAQLRQKY